MANLEIASMAGTLLVLPITLIATYNGRKGLWPNVKKIFRDGEKLPAKDSIRLSYHNGTSFGDEELFQHLTQLATKVDRVQDGAAVREWIERSAQFRATSYHDLLQPLAELDDHLVLRTHIIGHSLTAADLAVWGSIRGNKIAQSSIKKVANNVARWYNFIEASNPWIAEAVKEATASTSQQRIAASRAGASFEVDLPIIEGPMVTRFPPEPSGYLHIGHAKAALLNDYFAHKHTGGTLICRFDDTNPSKESMEFQDAILYDLKLMDVVPDRVTYSSESFQVMYDYAIQLIKKGKAFADDSELGKGGEDRKNRLPSKRRNMNIEETLARFAEMKAGSKEGQRWCIRARIAYDSPNGTLRDPVVYRCNLTPHHRTGTDWRMYPTYDFCAPILDAIEGVTVALRTNEYRDRNAQYEWMQDALGLRRVAIWDFSRMNFVRTVLSKRQLSKIVKEGKVWGWDDPRMPTIRGIIRRGMTIPALREFILKQGPSRNVLNLEWGQLWAMNKKYIDPIAPRHTAIVQDGAAVCHVSGMDHRSVIYQPRHRKSPELGEKKIVLSEDIVIEQADARSFEQDEEITLMNWGNAYVRKITQDSTCKHIVAIDLELHLEGDVKSTDKKITWLAATPANQVPVELIAFDHLITKDKLDKEDKVEEFLTPTTEFKSFAVADCNVAELPHGSIIQFERKGYFRLDFQDQQDRGNLVFFEIPTGKTGNSVRIS